MRNRRTGGIAMAVAVAAFAVGCVLYGAMKLAPNAGAAKAAEESEGTVERLPDSIANPDADGPKSLDVGDGSLATSVGLTSAEAAGGTVRVIGKAAVYDPRPNMKYIWGVRILSLAGESTLLEKLFYDHILSVPDDGNLKSDFDEFLELPFDSGTYSLELAWYAIPPDTGLDGLDVPSVREFNRSLGGRAEISIDQ